MDTPRILLLGVGNILFQDEGVGVHAIRRLEAAYTFSDNVKVLEGGVMGKLLMADIMDCDRLIVLDAVLGGEQPGAVYRLENDGLRKSLGFRDSQHQVDLVDTLISCELAGHRPEAVVIGVEPEEWRDMGLALTETVERAMPRLLQQALAVVTEYGGSARAKAA